MEVVTQGPEYWFDEDGNHRRIIGQTKVTLIEETTAGPVVEHDIAAVEYDGDLTIYIIDEEAV